MAGTDGEVAGATFRVALQSISVARKDAIVEDDFKTWAHTILLIRGRASNVFWYSDEGEGNLSKTSVTNGNEAAYNFSRQSRKFALVDATVNDLVNATLMINVYKGGNRDHTKDSLIGWASVDMHSALMSDRVKGALPLEPVARAPFVSSGGVTATPTPYAGTISVEVRAEAALEEFFLGSRVLTLPRAVLASIPKRWRLPASEREGYEEGAGADGGSTTARPPSASAPAPAAAGKRPGSAAPTPARPGTASGGAKPASGTPLDSAALANLAHDTAHNPYRYVLTLYVPAGKGVREWAVANGNLRYAYEGAPKPALPGSLLSTTARPTTPAPVAAGAKGGAPAKPTSAGAKDKAAAAAPAPAPAPAESTAAPPASPLPAGVWQVEWSGPTRLFLSQACVQGLAQHLASGAALAGQVRRVQIEGTEGAEDEPEDPAFPFDAGVRTVEEEWGMRASVSIAVDELLASGACEVSKEVGLAPVDVEQGEKDAAVEAKAKREAAWAEYRGKKATGGAAGGGKGGAGAAAVKSPAGKAAPAPAQPGTASGGKKPDPKAAAKAAAPADAPPVTPPPHPYTSSSTILACALTINSPINPAAQEVEPVEVTTADLVPPRPAAMALPAGLDSGQEFRREVGNAVALIAREYAGALRGVQGQAEAGAGAAASIDARRRAVVSALKSSGVYDAIKDRLRACAGRLVRERFARMPGVQDAPGSVGRDEFSTRLYSYMLGHMHAAINAVFQGVQEAIPAPATSLPAPRSPLPAVPQALPAGGGTSTPHESPSARLRRIAIEAEHTGHYARAARVHQTRVTLTEEAWAEGGRGEVYDPAPWTEYGLYLIRRGELLKASTCLKEAVAAVQDHAPALLALAVCQCARGLGSEACVFAAAAIRALQDKAEEHAREIAAQEGSYISQAANLLPTAHALHSLVLQSCGRSEEAGAPLVAAVRALAQQLSDMGASEDDANRCASSGSVYLLAARSLLDLRLLPLARTALSQASSALQDSDAPRCQKVDLQVLKARAYMENMRCTVPRECQDFSVLAGLGADALSADADAAGGGGEEVRTEGGAEASLARPAASAATDFAVTGVAYDGSIVAGGEAARVLSRACDLSGLHAEAWALRALLSLAGLLGARARTSFTGVDRPSRGAPDVGDADPTELAQARRALDMALGVYLPPLFTGEGASAGLHTVPRAHGPQPSSKPSEDAQQPPASARNPPSETATPLASARIHARADFIFASYSGVGGGLWASDEYHSTRLCLQAAGVLLQLASLESKEEVIGGMLSQARDLYVRAIRAPQVACPWALAWQGVGRAAWAQAQAGEAEAAFGEANALDNQSAMTWGWLAFVCLCSEPVRDREAAAALDQALRLGLCGDCTESTVLLHSLAERYSAMGQAGMATGLLRRAVVRQGNPISGAALDAALRARIALAECLSSSGALEDAAVQYTSVAASPATLPGELFPVPLKDSIRLSKTTAAAAAAALLTKLGKPAEAEKLRMMYGGSTVSQRVPAGGQ